MRFTYILVAQSLVVALAACSPAEPCTEVDAADAAIDSEIDAGCSARLIVGPVLLEPDHMAPPGGLGCGRYAAMNSVSLRVQLFDAASSGAPRLVLERVVDCTAGSDYVDIGAVPPGRYAIAVRTVGRSFAAGAALVEPPCRGDDGLPAGVWCSPLLAEVHECDTTVMPAALVCTDPTMLDCELL